MGLWSEEHLPDHSLEEPGPVGDGGHSLIHQRMHLDEVKCVIGELIGYLVPLHGWSAGTVARPAMVEKKNVKQGESHTTHTHMCMCTQSHKNTILNVDGINNLSCLGCSKKKFFLLA